MGNESQFHRIFYSYFVFCILYFLVFCIFVLCIFVIFFCIIFFFVFCIFYLYKEMKTWALLWYQQRWMVIVIWGTSFSSIVFALVFCICFLCLYFVFVFCICIKQWRKEPCCDISNVGWCLWYGRWVSVPLYAAKRGDVMTSPPSDKVAKSALAICNKYKEYAFKLNSTEWISIDIYKGDFSWNINRNSNTNKKVSKNTNIKTVFKIPLTQNVVPY